MKVLVCGGRNYSNFQAVCTVLNTYAFEAELVIHGGARGADSLAQDWADHHEICCKVYPADWEKYGKAAGPIRNKLMLEEKPDLVIAFPGGPGTTNMMKQAREAGVKVLDVLEMQENEC